MTFSLHQGHSFGKSLYFHTYLHKTPKGKINSLGMRLNGITEGGS